MIFRFDFYCDNSAFDKQNEQNQTRHPHRPATGRPHPPCQRTERPLHVCQPRPPGTGSRLYPPRQSDRIPQPGRCRQHRQRHHPRRCAGRTPVRSERTAAQPLQALCRHPVRKQHAPVCPPYSAALRLARQQQCGQQPEQPVKQQS